MPWPTLYDEHGAKRSTTVNTLNPDFLKWCKEHHEDPASAFEAAYYEVPVPWYNLAAAGDQRSYSLLIQGLHSHNLMIQVWAAMGLAKLQDPGAIDPIIAAVRNAPAETHDAMAKVLLHFQDSKAQAAADELFAHKEYLEPLRQQIKQQGLKELFPYENLKIGLRVTNLESRSTRNGSQYLIRADNDFINLNGSSQVRANDIQ